MSNLIERARQLRPIIEKAAASLSDEIAVTAVELFPSWNGNGVEYAVGDRVKYFNILYKCINAHTSQQDWTPTAAVSLWVRTDDPAIEYPDWRQPAGAHDAYTIGDKVTHNEKKWVSTADANVWEPGVFGWEEVVE